MKNPVFSTGILALIMLTLSGLPASAAAPAQPDELLGLCAQSALLPETELPAIVVRVDDMIKQLDNGTDPRRKVWIYRLRQCREFMVYRIDAAAQPGPAGTADQQSNQ